MGEPGGVRREKQLLIDFLCASAGGPMYYRGRDMKLCHRGMRISEGDWSVFLGHAGATLAKLQVPDAEQREIVVVRRTGGAEERHRPFAADLLESERAPVELRRAFEVTYVQYGVV